MRRQLDKLTREEDRLTTASQRLQAEVEAFRVQKETIKATYTAAEGSQRVHQAFVRMGVESILDEFFPGEGTEVETGAAAVVARNAITPSRKPGSGRT